MAALGNPRAPHPAPARDRERRPRGSPRAVALAAPEPELVDPTRSRAARPRRRAPGPLSGGRAPARARIEERCARRRHLGARPDHRSAQCRRHRALGRAFGVAAIVTTARHSPERPACSPSRRRARLEHVPFVMVQQSRARPGRPWRSAGSLLVGLDEERRPRARRGRVAAPLALVLGAEGKGLRQLTRASCQAVARLEMPGAIKSLNVRTPRRSGSMR